MLLVSERRRSSRESAGYSVKVFDGQGRFITAGRVANISEHGLFLVIDKRSGVKVTDEIVVKFDQPVERAGEQAAGKASYRCRVVRKRLLGGLFGVGVEVVEKLAE